MKSISRHEALVLGAATVAVASLPIFPAVAAPAESAPLLAWAVGTPGEYNWQHIVAKSSEDAVRRFICEEALDSCEGEDEAPCGECEECTMEVVASRVPLWDGKGRTISGDWISAGLGALCDHCGGECHRDDGAVISEENLAVCEDCQYEIGRIEARESSLLAKGRDE